MSEEWRTPDNIIPKNDWLIIAGDITDPAILRMIRVAYMQGQHRMRLRTLEAVSNVTPLTEEPGETS